MGPSNKPAICRGLFRYWALVPLGALHRHRVMVPTPHSGSREPVCSRGQGLCLLPLHPQKVGIRGVEGPWDEESGRFGFLEPQFS